MSLHIGDVVSSSLAGIMWLCVLLIAASHRHLNVQATAQTTVPISVIVTSDKYDKSTRSSKVTTDEWLRVRCTVTSPLPPDFDSSQLSITYANRARIPGAIVETNGTEICLQHRWTEPTRFKLLCAYRNRTNIYMHDVHVDTRTPRPPQQIACVSYMDSNITCTITPPKNMVFKLDVQMAYAVMDAVNAEPLRDYTSDNVTCEWERSKCYCTIRNPPYYPRFAIGVMLSNSVRGEVNENATEFVFDRKTAAVPPPVIDMLIDNADNGTTVSWTTPFANRTDFVPLNQLVYRLRYASVYDRTWLEHLCTEDDRVHNECSVRLSGLHGGTRYNVTLAGTATTHALLADMPSMWSAESRSNFTTPIRAPARSPRPTVGAFEWSAHGVTVYWTPLQAVDSNGPSVGYRVRCQQADRCKCRNITAVSGHCLTNRTRPPLPSPLVIEVLSVSAENQTAAAESIVVHGPLDLPAVPQHLRVISVQKRVQVFAWLPPPPNNSSNSVGIESYTVIWCPDQGTDDCTDDLHSAIVDATTTLNVTLEDQAPQRFGVAANSANTSSGLVWNRCRYDGRQTFVAKPFAESERVIVSLDALCLGCFESVRMTFCERSQPDRCTVETRPIEASNSANEFAFTLQSSTEYVGSVEATRRDTRELVPFSKPFEFATRRSQTDWMLWTAAGVVCAALAVAVCYLLCYALRRVHKMRDIGVQMPEALENLSDETAHRPIRQQGDYLLQTERLLRPSMSAGYKVVPATIVALAAVPTKKKVDIENGRRYGDDTKPTTLPSMQCQVDQINVRAGYIVYPQHSVEAPATQRRPPSEPPALQQQQQQQANSSGYVTVASLQQPRS